MLTMYIVPRKMNWHCSDYWVLGDYAITPASTTPHFLSAAVSGGFVWSEVLSPLVKGTSGARQAVNQVPYSSDKAHMPK